MNQVILVGRVKSEIKFIKEESTGVRKAIVDLEIQISKSQQECGSLTVPLFLSAKMAIISGDVLEVGKMIAIKGYLTVNHSLLEVHVEKLSFINTQQNSFS